MGDDWKSWTHRQKVVQQIDEILRNGPKTTKKKGAGEIEGSIFATVKTKDEYMHYISKFMTHIKDQSPGNMTSSSNLTAMLSGQQGNNQQIIQGATSGGQMTIGSSNNQMIHMANQQQQQQQQQLQQNNQMIHSNNTNHGNVAGTANQLNHTAQQQMTQNNMPNQMNTNVNVQNNMGAMMSPLTRMPQNMQANPNDINWQPINNKVRRPDMIMLNQKHGPMGNMAQMNASKMANMGIGMTQNEQMNQMNVSAQIPRSNLMQPRVPSPSYSAGNMSMARQGTPTPTNGSPAMQHVSHNQLTFISPSPSGPVPSPVGRTINHIGAPSPTGMLGTPGQPQVQQPSPAGHINMDDRAYIEKVKQLQLKYSDTLKEVALKFANNDSERARNVKNLLEVLENPQRRATMDTLRRCEVVLERLGGQQRNNRADTDSSKRDNPIAFLIDAHTNAMKSANGSHTIQRTLGPAIKTFFSSDLIPRFPKRKLSELLNQSQSDSHTINDTIQGEVARLPPRFKVNMDSQQVTGSDDVSLVCRLDDPNLPCVPPITMIIPPNYPRSAPKTTLPVVDYSVTPFLKRVCDVMSHRHFDLPQSCTITMVLNTWEMSVRQACSPKPFLPESLNPLINLTCLVTEQKVPL